MEAEMQTLSGALLVLMFLLNGMAPCLGFRIPRVISVFNSLGTEGDRWNHLFIPEALQVANYQEDLVLLVSSSDIWLNYYSDGNHMLPYFELRRRVWEDPDRPVQVTFVRAGIRVELDTRDPDAAEILPPVSFPANKIMAFRLVDRAGPVRCRW